ncbi:MAG: ComEC/Rec2 family competence protein [Limibacillus sp.]
MGARGEAAERVRATLAPDGLLVWAPVPFALGTGLYFGLAREPDIQWLLYGLAPTAVLLLSCYRLPALRLLLLGSLLVQLGLLNAAWRSDSVGTPLIENRLPPQILEGRIDLLEADSGSHRLVLSGLRFEKPPEGAPPRRVRLRLASGGEALEPGDRIRLRAVLLPPSRPLVPGGFDFARRAYFQGIGAVGYAYGTAERTGAAPPQGVGERWRGFWNGLRLRIGARIQEVVPGQAGAVAVALVTGQRGALSEETEEAMRRSGLAHLLAISGLHLGLVAATLVFSLRFALAAAPGVALRWPIKKIAAVGGMVAAFCYLFLAGATIPAQRAFVMVAIALFAVLLERNPFSLRLVAAAAFLVLAVAPESLLSPSFQLSFAAVTALVAFFRHSRLGAPQSEEGERGGTSRLLLYFLVLSTTSLIAILATTPFALHHFGRVTPYGLFANLVAVPLTALIIMPAAVAAGLLWPLGLEALALAPMGWAIELLLFIAGWFSSLPGASLALPTLPLGGLLMVTAGGLWLSLTRGRARWLGLLLVIPGLAASPLKPLPDLLVDERGELIALRGEEGRYYLSSLRREAFTRKLWLQHLGETQAGSWREAQETGAVQCDSKGCLIRREGLLVAVSATPEGAAEDCLIADLVISREPLRRVDCPAPLGRSDLYDLFDEGAHLLTFEGGPEIRLETVEESRGQRPWTRQPR